MKKILFVSICFLGLFVASCSKKSSDDGSGSGTTSEKPVIKLSKSSIIADGFEETVISVVDKNGNDITSQCWVTGNSAQITNFTYFTNAQGTVTLKAKLNGVESNPVSLSCTSPGTSRHAQKVMAEDYTGAWCGYCPRVAYSLDQASAANPNIIVSAVHNADALAYALEASMRSRWGVSGFPTVVINRNFTWNESTTTLTNQLNKWAPLGLAIESNIAGTTISGKIKTQFNVTTDVPLTVTVMLLENGKVLAQRNYMNAQSGSPFFGQGDPIAGYVHNHILRASATDIFGDAIPSASVVRDNIYEKTFSFNAAAYDLTKCEIVAIASFADGLVNRKGVLNVQKVKAGLNKGFD